MSGKKIELYDLIEKRTFSCVQVSLVSISESKLIKDVGIINLPKQNIVVKSNKINQMLREEYFRGR